jgi:hypothetical protein
MAVDTTGTVGRVAEEATRLKDEPDAKPLPRQVGDGASIAAVHARGGSTTKRAGDGATTGVNCDDEPRRVEGNVVECELDRRRAEWADVERLHPDCTCICTPCTLPHPTAITKIRAEPI